MAMSITTEFGRLPNLAPKVQIATLIAILLSAALHNFLGVFISFSILIYLCILSYPFLYIGKSAKYMIILPIYAFLQSLSSLDNTLFARIEESVKLLYLPIFLVLIAQCSRRSILIYFYILSALTALAFASYTFSNEFYVVDFLENRRFSGIFPSANHCGYAISVTLLLLFRIYITRAANPKTLIIMMMMLIPPFLATRSSGALLMTGGVLLLILLSEKITISYRFAGVLILSLVMLVLPFLDISISTVDKFAYFDFDVAVDRAAHHSFGNQGSSLGWRVSYWLAIFEQYIQGDFFDILFGYGGGSTTKGNMAFAFMTHDPHSDILGLVVEYGAIGLILFLFATYKYCAGTENRWISMAIFLGPMLAGNSLGSLVVMSVILPSVEFFRVKTSH